MGKKDIYQVGTRHWCTLYGDQLQRVVIDALKGRNVLFRYEFGLVWMTDKLPMNVFVRCCRRAAQEMKNL